MDPNEQDIQINPNGSQPLVSEASASLPSKPPLWQRVPWKVVAGITGALVVIVLGFLIAKTFLFKGSGGEETRVREFVWWGFQFEEEDVAPIISEYEKKTGVRVTYIKQAKQDYKDRLTVALERGREAPDIFEIHNSWPVMLDTHLSRVPSEVYSKESYRDTFYPVMSRDLERAGGFVGIPLVFDGLALFVNLRVFESNDKLPPDTWNEVWELSEFFTKREAGGRIVKGGIPMGRTDNVEHWQEILALMLLQEGANLEAPNGEQAGAAFKSYVSFADPYKGVWNETLPSSLQAFSKGQTQMFFGKAEDVSEIKRINPDLQFRVLPMPQLPKTSSSQQDIMWASYWAEAVWEKSKKKSAAWDFLKFMASREVLNVLASGKFAPSRQDLADLFREDPLFGAFVKSAPVAYSWYLASDTQDGAKGINSRMSTYYKAAVLEFAEGRRGEEVLKTLSSGVAGVLGEY